LFLIVPQCLSQLDNRGPVSWAIHTGLEIGVLCFARVQYNRLRVDLRNNKAPAISRAGRNRARIVVSYKTFAILREVWLTCNNLRATADDGSGRDFRSRHYSSLPSLWISPILICRLHSQINSKWNPFFGLASANEDPQAWIS